MYDVTTGSCMGYVYNNIPIGNILYYNRKTSGIGNTLDTGV